jgi:hypothetical protein
MKISNPSKTFSNKELNFLLDVAFEAMGLRLKDRKCLKKIMDKHNIPEDEDAPCYPHDHLNAKLIDYLNEVSK